MATQHYDVIIIGTGAGGGTLAHKLAPSGKRVLVLERGGYLPREPGDVLTARDTLAPSNDSPCSRGSARS